MFLVNPYLTSAGDENASRFQAVRRGVSGPETGETVMKEFIESARRETGDSHVVTLLTTAVIVLAAIVMAATSFTLA